MTQLWIVRSPPTGHKLPREPINHSVAQLEAEGLMSREIDKVALHMRLGPGNQVVGRKGLEGVLGILESEVRGSWASVFRFVPSLYPNPLGWRSLV